MAFKKASAAVAAFFMGVFVWGEAMAAKGLPEAGKYGLQDGVTEIWERINSFHDMLLVIIFAITAFVFALLAYAMIRFRKSANPTPATFSHNTPIEIIWTVVPIIILAAITLPSMRLLYFQDVVPKADMVIKATGYQWYWNYEYPDYDELSFDSIMLPNEYFDPNASEEVKAERAAAASDIQRMLGRDEAPEFHRLLDTDTRIVVPVNTTVKVIVTAADVIHAWTVPSFGVKIDAIPGRLNETWFNAKETGTYYGQCSELCGIKHAFMPIVVEVVSQDDFDAWLARAKTAYATNGLNQPAVLASAE
ncbi:MAG: cytochrome c oxidase subunit II [Sphingomonadales bacterium]|nr:cytochrome c oxidase subunit II [Sphingomonadales bacterium]